MITSKMGALGSAQSDPQMHKGGLQLHQRSQICLLHSPDELLTTTPHSRAARRAARKQQEERRRQKQLGAEAKRDRRVMEAEILGVKQPRQVRVLTPEERRREELKTLELQQPSSTGDGQIKPRSAVVMDKTERQETEAVLMGAAKPVGATSLCEPMTQSNRLRCCMYQA